jgi:GH18 family chitinase
MREMRAAYGKRYGLSIVLAPDYWYLRGFKPAAMQEYVDHMGFMSYDLHGPWDTDVKTLGSYVHMTRRRTHRLTMAGLFDRKLISLKLTKD